MPQLIAVSARAAALTLALVVAVSAAAVPALAQTNRLDTPIAAFFGKPAFSGAVLSRPTASRWQCASRTTKGA